jgi:predicted dehydrogenase
MSKTLGVGVIGCGNISATYLKLAPLFKGFEIRSVADLDMAAADARAAEFGVAAQTVKDLLANQREYRRSSSTSRCPPSHHKVSKQILEAGKHVYSEKPLTLSVTEARTIAGARRTKKKLKRGGRPRHIPRRRAPAGPQGH